MYSYKYKYKYDVIGPERTHSKNISILNQDQYEKPAENVLGDGVTGYGKTYFYRCEDPAGSYFALLPGQSTPKPGTYWNDRVTSMVMSPRTVVLLTRDWDYRGVRYRHFNFSNEPYPGPGKGSIQIEKGISSFVVLPLSLPTYQHDFTGYQRACDENNPLRTPGSFISQEESPKVENVLGAPITDYESSTFYRTTGQQGYRFKLYPGQSTQYPGEDWGNRIGSVNAGARTAILLTDGTDFEGDLTIVENGDRKAHDITFQQTFGTKLNWDNRVNSVAVLPLPL